MRLAHHCAVFFAALVVLGGASAVRADDDGDVRKAAGEFITALHDGDAQSAKACAASNPEGEKWIDRVVSEARAAERLRRATSARFKSSREKAFEFSPLPSVADARVQVEGDTAVFNPKFGNPLHLVKVDGAWKADLRYTPPNFGGSSDKITAVLDQLTIEVEAGRYATIAEVRTAFLNALGVRRSVPRARGVADTQPSPHRVDQNQDGTLVLWARDAMDVAHCRIDKVSDVQCVTGWTDEHDTLKWDAAIKTYRVPGLYEVMVTYACDPGAGASEYVVESGNQHLTGKTTVTGEPGGWPQFNSEAIGTLRFDRPADITITLRATKKTGREVMHLRSIVLKPATADQVAERLKLASPGPSENADGHAPTICVDISELPDLEDWGYGCRVYCRKWYTVIDNLLHTDGFTPPRVLGIRVILDPHSVGFNDNGGQFNLTAYTTPGNTIIVFHTWALPNDYGMEVHEMSHVIQKYPRYEFWVVEGIADYIRYYVAEPGSRAAAFDPATAHYKNGYQASSAFLNWMEREYGQPPHTSIISRLNNALRHDRYNVGIFKDITGKDVDELWAEFKKTLEPAKDKAD